MTELSTIYNIRKPIFFGIVGQSVESDVVRDPETEETKQAYESLRNPGVQAPMAGNVALDYQNPYYKRRGGLWFKTYDDMWDHGYDLRMFNGAIGSMSMVSHACGMVSSWSANTAFYAHREPEGHGDRGDWGSMTVQDGKLFRCKTGRRRYAFLENPNRHKDTGIYGLDYISGGLDVQVSGLSAPTWSSAAVVGDTVADGSIIWEVIDATNSLGYSNGQILDQKKRGWGFDPLSILARVAEESKRMRVGTEDGYILLCNGQSDAGQSATNYKNALTYVANYFLSQGFKVLIGLSCFNPASATTTQYDNLTAGVAAAIADRQAAFPGKVFAGANLYATMGTSLAGLLQADNTHLNAAGAIIAGEDHADALKAVLPVRTLS